MRKQKPREIQWLTDGRTYSEIQYFLHNLEGYIPENLHGKEKLCWGTYDLERKLEFGKLVSELKEVLYFLT